MISLAISTYIHLIFIVIIFCCLIVEFISIKQHVSYRTIARLSRVDGLYGLAAIIVVVTGLLNWMKFGKGYDYYANNTLFAVKFSLFIIVGLLSLYPTILILKIKKSNKKDRSNQIELTSFRIMKNVITLELIIMTCIPLLAELMANGIDI